MEKQETPTEKRRAVIRMTVDYYMENYPVEYQQVIKKVNQKRFAKNTEFAEFKEKESGPSKTDYMQRHLLDLPERLYLALQAAVGDPLQDKKELAWFCKKYPQFLVTKKY